MSIKITIPNSSSDVLTFGSGNTPTAAQIAGIDSGSSNGQLALYTTASGTSTERVRVDASGNLGLGVTPSAGTSGKVFQITNAGHFMASGPTVYIDANAYFDSGWKYITTAAASNYYQNSGAHIWQTAASGTAGNALTWTTGMTLDSSGNLLVGTTSVNFAGSGFTLSTNSGTTKWLVGPISGTAGNFYIASSGSTGVYLNGTGATSWSSNSDERLKTDLKPIENATEKVASLRAVTGRYKTDEEGYSRAFLIAQDVQAVLPEAVAPTTMYDGTEVLGLAYTETIPLLVAAIKEQQALIQTLTDRITALENK